MTKKSDDQAIVGGELPTGWTVSMLERFAAAKGIPAEIAQISLRVWERYGPDTGFRNSDPKSIDRRLFEASRGILAEILNA